MTRNTLIPLQLLGLAAAVCAITLFVLAAAPRASAQEVEDTITTSTSLVQLNVGVVDRQGRAITSLSQRDFAVYEDGVRQTIQRFEPVESPFSLVLLLDMSGSTVNFRQQLKLASIRFLDALGPQDRICVIQFNAKVKALTDFTTDRKKIDYAIDVVAQGAGETNFYDALKFSLKELEKEGEATKGHRCPYGWTRFAVTQR